MDRIKDVTAYLESIAPLPYQESYDNAGLILGDRDKEVTGILISIDVTEEVLDEAINLGCNMVVSHHPIIFKGLKKLTGDDYVQRTVLKAIKNNIALYAIHTNLDNIRMGVNARICQNLELIDMKILVPREGTLSKLVSFVPKENREQVLKALYNTGAGVIGDYDHCSFSVSGTGTYRPGDQADPYIGSSGADQTVEESRIEVIFPTHLSSKIVQALKSAHPYEEAAYYLTDIENINLEVGSGMTGNLEQPMKGMEFLSFLKEKMKTPLVRHSPVNEDKMINKVAVCGGSGSFLTKAAIQSGADIFITGDIKYHEFFDADGKIVLADIGHYESEAFTKDLLYDLLIKKFNTFALHLSKAVTNPINYF
jgi:dinuclear metal center YbgI/SA1388 family protein